MDHRDAPLPRALWLLPFVPLLLVYLSGLFVPVMEVDAAQYASITRELQQRGNWLQFFHRGEPYLDKPPLLFWLSAALFQVFGPSTWAYKLPSVLAAIVGVHAIGRFTERWYGMRLGWAAALILASSVALLLHTNDIRTDTLLMAFVAVAIWQFGAYLHPSAQNPTGALLAGWLAVGLAMLSKGPIGLMAPVLAVSTHLLLKRQLGVLLRPRVWLTGLIVVPLVLSPMLIGLYQQYGSEGLYFYFWKQSFGRLTGENVWRDDSGPLFFTHTFLWLFLPWAIAAIVGLIQQIRSAVQGRLVEGLSIGGFVLPFIAMSLSQYKLPHYLLACLPMAAVLAARGLQPALEGHVRAVRAWVLIQSTQATILGFAAIVLAVWAFPVHDWYLALPSIALLIAMMWMGWMPGFPERAYRRVMLPTVGAMAAMFLLLNLHIYPKLLTYQSATQVGVFYREEVAEPRPPLVFLNTHAQAVDWEGRGLFPILNAQMLDSARRTSPLWVYTGPAELDSLTRAGVVPDRTLTYPHYHITRITPRFLNPKTRPAVLNQRLLLLLPQHKPARAAR